MNDRIVLLDGLDLYSTIDDFALYELWDTSQASGAGTSDLDYLPDQGRFGGGAVRASGGTGTKVLSASVPDPRRIIVGMQVRFDDDAELEFLNALCLNENGDPEAMFRCRINRDFTFALGTSDDPTIAVSERAIHESKWVPIELEIDLDGDPMFRLHVNSELWLEATFVVNTCEFSEGMDQLAIGVVNSSGGGPTFWFDDLYLMNTDPNDGSFSDPPVTLGDWAIVTLLPEADRVVELTPITGGTNFEEVDDPGIDGDGTYNASDVVGERDVFDLAVLDQDPNLIHTVAWSLGARKDGGGARSMLPVVQTVGSAETPVGPVSLDETYGIFKHLFANDPDGSVAWDRTRVDALGLGYEIA